ncbi:hypothetical protein ACS0TY_016337 [Phlomoides rotata]
MKLPGQSFSIRQILKDMNQSSESGFLVKPIWITTEEDKIGSSPHYLAEIVIYGGLVIATGFSDITIWLVFGFVVANLTSAAAETQKWYFLRKLKEM